MPACLWGQEYEIEFVKSHLGPAAAQGRQSRPRSGSSTTTTTCGAAPSTNSAMPACTNPSTASHGTATWASLSAMTRVHDAFPAEERLLDRGRARHQFARLPDRLVALGANLQRHREQLGALDYRVEYRARRTGQAECRAVFLRRVGHHRQRDASGDAQRAVLGLRAFLPPRAARGQGDCRKRRGRYCGGGRCRRCFSRRIPQSRRRHGGGAGQSRTAEADPVAAGRERARSGSRSRFGETLEWQ